MPCPISRHADTYLLLCCDSAGLSAAGRHSDQHAALDGVLLLSGHLLGASLLGCLLHNVVVCGLEVLDLLADGDEAVLDLLADGVEVVDLDAHVRDDLQLGLLDEDAIDQPPALASVLKRAY